MRFMMIGFAAAVIWAGEDAQVISRQLDEGLPRGVLFATPPNHTALRTAEEVKAALEGLRDLLALDEVTGELNCVQESESLLGRHYHFQQQLFGVPILDAEIVVSVSNESGDIYRIDNRSISARTPRAKTYSLLPEDAVDVAWHHLGVHGRLSSLPEARMVYVEDEGELTLVYQTQVATDGPYGSWEVLIDANRGDVLRVRDTNIYRKPKTHPSFDEVDLPVKDRADAEAAFLNKAEKTIQSAKTTVNGTAWVFDPDPRTTLMREDLHDNSPAEAFEPAYLQRPLLEITESNGTYQLSGPFCRIAELDYPPNPPSTTSDGIWDFPRGNNAFNDATTYFHVDDTQRYLQSLGFQGQKAIQDNPIPVDTDGEYGADNSHYDVNNNLLVFGHGCVDDNEDADVIRHEYGHAIQFGVHGSWWQGDAGAISEAFSDYWAASYSYGTENGRAFNPNWMFSWDGHNNCWSGRIMNAMDARYDPSRSYSQHEYIPGGYISEELFSTPIFQAMMDLVDQGVRKRDMDTIFIESHFGFASGIRMPQMAEHMIANADALYPHQPHAHILREHFARHGIAPATDEYVYISPHVPPAGDTSAAWLSEIRLMNPQSEALNVLAEVYGDDGQTTPPSFILLQSTQITLQPGETTTFVPEGLSQRWVRFTASAPLAGSTAFFRTAVEERGQERAAMPLFDMTHRGTKLIIPHVPANRAKFWSGAVILNPGDQTQQVSIQLVGEHGNDLSHLALDGSSLVLGPHEKWVGYLTGGLFDDTASEEKVSYVRLRADTELVSFELYGYQDDLGFAATSGIAAMPDAIPQQWVVRMDLNQLDWAGISMLNPADQGAQLTLTFTAADGSEMQTVDYTLPARHKVLGLHTLQSGFQFPYSAATSPTATFPQGSSLSAITIEADQPLRVMELSGDDASSNLDGSAATGGRSRVVFTEPSGILQVINGNLDDQMTVTARDAQGQIIGGVGGTITLAHHALLQIDVRSWNAASISVQGKDITALMISRDADQGSLTIVSPAQVLGRSW